MLVNEKKEQIINSYSEDADIKFIRYYNFDEYCNLCHGILELSINGRKASFGSESTTDFPSFFYPTVCFADADCERASHTSWETDVCLLPDELKPFAKMIDNIINQNMPNNICRGCD